VNPVPRRHAVQVLVALFLVAALPFVAALLRGTGAPRCALDGRVLDTRSIVAVTTADEVVHAFCSVVCAESWLEALRPDVTHILVTDEVGGRTLPASRAYFVRSRVPTPTPSQDPIHVFADEAQAREHAGRHRGIVLEGALRPFRRLRGVQIKGQWKDSIR
jgi:hypothetical protein